MPSMSVSAVLHLPCFMHCYALLCTVVLERIRRLDSETLQPQMRQVLLFRQLEAAAV